MALKSGDLPDNERELLGSIKGQMDANRHGRDLYVAARDSGDQAGMDINKPSYLAFEQYAHEYRLEAGRLGVTSEPDDSDVPAAVTQPGERDIGSVPAKADPQGPMAEPSEAAKRVKSNP